MALSTTFTHLLWDCSVTCLFWQEVSRCSQAALGTPYASHTLLKSFSQVIKLPGFSSHIKNCNRDFENRILLLICKTGLQRDLAAWEFELRPSSPALYPLWQEFFSLQTTVLDPSNQAMTWELNSQHGICSSHVTEKHAASLDRTQGKCYVWLCSEC